MSAPTRRQFLGQLGASVVAAGSLSSRGAADALRPPLSDSAADVLVASRARSLPGAPPYDLLIKGGRVIDAALGPPALLDVAIKNGVVDRVAANIPRTDAREVYDATGRVVTPGLIDMHAHVFDGVATSSIDADEVGLRTGVTTIVDAGSSGATTFPGFRKRFIETAQVDVYALLNISRIGLIVNNETYIDPALINAGAATSTINANKDRILGIKVRINGRASDLPRDIEVLKVARQSSDATGVPILMHWSNEPDLLALMKKGDTLIHPFNPPSTSSSNLIGGEGAAVLPQILELKARGIWTDFAHGNHLDWTVAETAAKTGWFPDTISTDLHRGHVAPNGVVIDLVTTMSKFLFLGMPLERVIEAVTTTPNKVLAFPQKIGTLAEGSVGNVSVLEVEQGQFELFDSRRASRMARQKIKAVAVVQQGRLMEMPRPEA